MKVDLVNKINIFVGKRNSGKSILMKHMMKQFHSSFRKTYLISPSEKINKFYGDIVKNECIYDEYNEKWMEMLILNMTKQNEGLTQKDKKFSNILLVLDDLASDANFHSSKSLQILVARGRHVGITLYISLQHLNSCGPLVRSNSDYIFCGKLSRTSLELLIENYMTGEVDRKQFINMYNKSTINYNFLIIYNNATINNDLNLIYSSIKVENVE